MLPPFMPGPIGLVNLLPMGLSMLALSGSPRLDPAFSDCVLRVIDGAPLMFIWNPDMA